MSTQPDRTVMVIEDDEDILSTLTDFLEGEGYGVETATNGAKALEILSDRKRLPDLILLDMRMPTLDGWKFAAAFRTRFGHSTPIVVMTAAPDAEQRAKEVGATGWMSKPFNLDDLVEQLKHVS